jgi:hypothetical protein
VKNPPPLDVVTVTQKHGFASMAQNTAKLVCSSSALSPDLSQRDGAVCAIR